MELLSGDSAVIDVINAYRTHQEERRLSVRTIEDNNGRLNQFVEFVGNVPLNKIKPAQIHDYFVYMRDERGLSEATRGNRKSTLRAFFNWCVKEKLITYENDPSHILLDNQAHKYSFEPKAHQAVEDEYLTAVLRSLPSYLAESGYSEMSVRDSLIVSLTADSAVRRKAIWSIRRRDMLQAVTSSGPIYVVYSVLGKTGTEKVRFFEETASIARMYLNLIPKTAVWLFENPATNARYRIDGLRKSFTRLCKFAGVPPFLFQSVRKRDVMDAIKASGDITVGQRYAGHKSSRTTQVYYNLIKDEEIGGFAAQISTKRRGGGDDLMGGFFG